MKKVIYTTKTNIIGEASKTIAAQLENLITQPESMILAAIKANESEGGRNGKPIKFIFTGEAAERITALLSKHNIQTKTLIDALLSSLESKATEESPVQELTPMARWLAYSYRQPREGQDQFYSNILSTMKDGKIGLCEASTGAGKTTAILSAVADTIKGSRKRALIATPAVSLVRDFAIEHARLGKEAPKLRIFLGMGEFISQVELLAFIDTWTGFDEQTKLIKKWINSGAKSLETGLSQPYLKHTLRLISPNIPLDEVLLRDTHEDTDEGMQSYRAQFNKENDTCQDEEILLCSHAMLAVDLRTRLAVAARHGDLQEKRDKIGTAWKTAKALKEEKLDTKDAIAQAKIAQKEWDETVIATSLGFGKLPDFAYLVVDEAHLLEQSFSNSLSSYVAIHQFMQHAKSMAASGLLSKGAAVDIEKAYHQLCNSSKQQNTDTIHISQQNADIFSPIQQIANAAKKGLEKLTQKRQATLSSESLQRIKSFRNDLACINQAAHFATGQIAYLNLSPRLAYPRLFVGKSSVDHYLRFLWSSVQSAACVSATLYLPKDDGISSWYMQSILAIPEERKQDFEPVIPTWIRNTVKEIRMPSCGTVDGHIPLRPSSRSDKLTDDQKEKSDATWCKEVADEISKIYDTAAGGCLVLMTSYSYVNKVKNYLMENPLIAENLVFAQQGEPETKSTPKLHNVTINEQQRKYLQLAYDGKKPIWLALGNAWTGINLSGGDPMKDLYGEEIPSTQDNVLTDLIIPRLPFGVNKSVTHAYRTTNKKKVQWERIDTLLRIRQGVGRLVRRHGVPKNRRIHILDARLCQGILAGMMPAVYKAIGGK